MDIGSSLNHRVMRFNETQVNILKNLDKKKPNMKKATKQVYDKKTGERYPSKAVMMKHEKGESKSVQKNEEAKFAAKKVAVKKMQGKTAVATKKKMK
jgi:hypothetical protein